MIPPPVERQASHRRSGAAHAPSWHGIYVTTSLSRSSGGPFHSVSGLARAVAAEAPGSVSVVGAYADAALWPEDCRQWSATPLAAVPYRGLLTVGAMRRCLRTVLDSVADRGAAPLVHLHGLWDAASLTLASTSESSRIPLVISPRGMLEPWALRHRGSKKKLALTLWQRSQLVHAGLLHATSAMECEGFRQAGLRNPVAIVPNGIDLPADIGDLGSRASREAPSSRRCVFLSRLHPKKGLPMLLAAWARLRPRGWTLQIAGSGEPRHEREVRDTIERLKLDGVTLEGDLRGADKWRFLATADLFVLPTYSENFGIAVAEAMAAGLPVITTRGTPWQVLRDEQMGWWVDADEPSLTGALREATSAPSAVLAERGGRARSHAIATYSWPAIGRRMLDCYRWLRGIGPTPTDIVFE